VVGDGRRWEGGEERSRSAVLGLLGLGLLGLRERESWERDGVGRWAGGLGGRRSVGGPFGGQRSVRWTLEMYGGEGKIWEMAGAGGRQEQWPTNCSGRRTSVVVGGGDGVSFERILKFWFFFFFFNQKI
jgi:hypothetical protein